MLTQFLSRFRSRFTWKDTVRLFATGFTMGAADIVPGVSGGTVAFLLGIYEELIHSIKTVTGKVLRLGAQGKIKEAWDAIPFRFLVPLAAGLGTALVTLAPVIGYLLATQPRFVWSFFFGLVLASVYVVRKRVVTWDFHDVVAAGVAAVLAYVIVGAVPVETPNTPIMIFLSGVIAICAMILPGISGSFLLLILGKYEQILAAISDFDVVRIGIFGAGAVVGIAVFSRVLSYLFSKHHDLLIAILTGFMLGSLRKVWPWKEVISTRINSHGEVVPFLERNILPGAMDASLLLCLVLGVVGFACVLLLDRLQVTKEHVQDIPDGKFTREYKKSVRSQKNHQI